MKKLKHWTLFIIFVLVALIWYVTLYFPAYILLGGPFNSYPWRQVERADRAIGEFMKRCWRAVK